MPWGGRQRVLLSNFRSSTHPVRTKAEREIYPLLSGLLEVDARHDEFAPPDDPAACFEWEKTGRRHHPDYYDRLARCAAVSCFGGYLSTGLLFWPRLTYALDRRLGDRFKNVYQWDSFRLWEAFASGCLVLHLDFEAHGLELPVGPVNRRHYLGFDLRRPAQAAEFLREHEADLTTVADAGRRWALEHYSPRPMAERFLRTLGWDV